MMSPTTIILFCFFFFNDTGTTEIYTLSLRGALPISAWVNSSKIALNCSGGIPIPVSRTPRSEEHTSELQSRLHLVCRLRLGKKRKKTSQKTQRRDKRKCPQAPEYPNGG